MYRHTYMYIHTDTCTHTHTNICTHTHTKYKKLQYFVTSTHRAWYCTLGGGREYKTHSFLCFHCAQLLSSLMAPSANDRSGLSSEPAEQDGPGGHTRPHHNFHSPMRAEISRPGVR
ncbi:unnamed protein product, partial [Staurois parvus]